MLFYFKSEITKVHGLKSCQAIHTELIPDEQTSKAIK